jgi:hypothetical protein
VLMARHRLLQRALIILSCRLGVAEELGVFS